MIKLNKHKLDFDLAWKYVQDNLEQVNALSTELLSLLNFREGSFFTLLTDNADLDRVYQFEWGGILPQNPIEEYYVNGHKATYSIKNSINDELSDLILKKISSNCHLSCIMDDVSGEKPKDRNHPCYFDNYSVFYDKEFYSILNQTNISYDLILKCLRFSTSFWHSLGLITTSNLENISKTVSLEKIKEICLKTELVMVGAYDAEGYVFWEKNLTNENGGFLSI